ncbi:hypothetical protein VTG60DRAFT_4254 [Thermothelomyces hinnuleus]
MGTEVDLGRFVRSNSSIKGTRHPAYPKALSLLTLIIAFTIPAVSQGKLPNHSYLPASRLVYKVKHHAAQAVPGGRRPRLFRQRRELDLRRDEHVRPHPAGRGGTRWNEISLDQRGERGLDRQGQDGSVRAQRPVRRRALLPLGVQESVPDGFQHRPVLWYPQERLRQNA